MRKVPNKPNKRRSKKQENTPSVPVRSSVDSNDEAYQRFLQANAIRKQIKDNVGDIFSEIPRFELSLTDWVSTGIRKHGTCEVPRLQRVMEWLFHPDIRKYPEVWFRDLE